MYFHLIPNFGKLTLEELKIAHVYQWLETINISNKRINNVLVPLRQAFQEAFYDELIDSKPMDRFRYRSPETREPQPFNHDEIQRILAQLEGQEKSLIQFAFWSGLRTSELIALRWEDIDLPNNRFYVRTV
ncbi:tyrosine-type recombinase/integrase [Neptunomonas phycophila]|uniref:tyrosine-type recombinase/integrase n=1 Tax=Neptunomonas phycophila TaxID=1572645 RepID=UPI0026E1F1CE|nr:tyrosine-type recombinase/integrase [Neptunomonas phycophila]MDO6467838.1 tyrosine-type recombinase/integrase [Neptunomonas phycophila]